MVLVSRLYEPATVADYLRLVNYSLILLPFIDLGRATYVASSPSANSEKINSLWLISGGVFIPLLLIAPHIALYAAILAYSRYVAAIAQRGNKWVEYSVLNLLPNLGRLVSVVLVWYSNLENMLIEAVIAFGTIFILTGRMILCSDSKKDVQPVNNKADSLFHHAAIGIIIALAMRIDLLVFDIYFSENQFVEYGLVFQLILVVPLFTNALINFSMVNSVSNKKLHHPIRVVLMLIVVSPLVYFTIHAVTEFLYYELTVEILITGVFVAMAAAGGLYYSSFEGQMYKNEPRTLMQMKVIQLCVLSLMVPIYYFEITDSTICVGILVFLSRFYAWLVIYVKHSEISSRKS